eukprot:757953-Hanusia_phi.AAC.1
MRKKRRERRAEEKRGEERRGEERRGDETRRVKCSGKVGDGEVLSLLNRWISLLTCLHQLDLIGLSRFFRDTSNIIVVCVSRSNGFLGLLHRQCWI